jgi:hypothetical protein
MPHEHVNSSIVDDEHRIQIIWKPMAHLTSAYDEPEEGYVQIMTERPSSDARFPSPKMIELPARHVFEPAGSDLVCVRCGLEEDAYEIHRPKNHQDTVERHVFKSAVDNNTCIYCGQTENAINAYHGPVIGVGLPATFTNTVTEAVRVEYAAGENTWTEPCTGFAITVSREDINRVIRLLRKARDQAFGADA